MRQLRIALMVGLCLVALRAGAQAAAPGMRTITVRVLDARTGKPVSPSNLLVRIDEQSPIHLEWVKQNDDATGMITLPDSARLVSVEATYDNSMEIYVNCDTAPEAYPGERRWYSIQTILNAGLAGDDGCVKPKKRAEMKTTATPGELIFFVRERKHGDPEVD